MAQCQFDSTTVKTTLHERQDGQPIVEVEFALPHADFDLSKFVLEISESRVSLRMPGLEAVSANLGCVVDVDRATAQCMRRKRRLVVRAPVSQAGPPCSGSDIAEESLQHQPDTCERDPSAEEVEGSGGVVMVIKDVFDPSHSTTQLMFSWIRSVAVPQGWLSGARVLDYGCGTGALGLCALLHGARNMVGVDMNRKALDATVANARANGLQRRVQIRLPPERNRDRDFDDFFGDFEQEWKMAATQNSREGGDIPSLDPRDAATCSFDVVFANMRKRALLRNASQIVSCCRPGGVVAVSGFMVDFEEKLIIGAFRAAGLQCRIDFDAPNFAEMGDIRTNGARCSYGMFWGFRPEVGPD
eukprot:CAMPEP_0183473438 /NCGR_PEP_ID=MMETSP0370-20130417/161314_1 /TAXON_ID=268820 /ORGANISM="Peridinium aciculiferum, Strain PAER-2" /LENGTH=357 /DNA_ID=CAMNT_0025666129 /DNA_START=60 /DNA_END=1133 /DNA_ORIENTATION=+